MDPAQVDLYELKTLFSEDYVRTNKINCIKLLRQITGAGLREAKDFFELVIDPAIIQGIEPNPKFSASGAAYTSPRNDAPTLEQFKELEERLQRVEAFMDSHNIAEAQTRAKAIFKED